MKNPVIRFIRSAVDVDVGITRRFIDDDDELTSESGLVTPISFQ